MELGPTKEQIENLKAAGYSVYTVCDQDPCVYAWMNSSGAAQSDSDIRARQPFRLSAAQAWDDCNAYYSGCVPRIANPDWMSK